MVSNDENSDDSKNLQMIGLINGQSYTILDAAVVKDKAGQDVRIVKLRNPQGRLGFEWKGNWSDESDMWTDESLAKMNHKIDTGDGVFCMQFDDFNACFDYTYFCEMNDSYEFSYFSSQFEKDGLYMFTISVEKAGKYTIGVS